jgi:hypothetical protein
MRMYGGGENFINYTLAILGYKKWIYPDATLFHHGAKRDYHFTFDGVLYNRMIAHYLFGGSKVLKEFAQNTKGDPSLKIDMVNKIIETQKQHRYHIKERQKVDLQKWVLAWQQYAQEDEKDKG